MCTPLKTHTLLLALLVLICLLVLTAPPAFAQATAVNPTTVEFTASPDHAGAWLNGDAKVTEYRAVYFYASSDVTTATPVAVISIGKPAPNAAGAIAVTAASLPALFGGLAHGVVYKATIDTVGPSGSSRSTASGPFGFETRTAPGPASLVVVPGN